LIWKKGSTVSISGTLKTATRYETSKKMDIVSKIIITVETQACIIKVVEVGQLFDPSQKSIETYLIGTPFMVEK